MPGKLEKRVYAEARSRRLEGKRKKNFIRNQLRKYKREYARRIEECETG